MVPIVPFKHEGVYRIITAMPGGSTFHREYALHRNGFEGPLKVRLADKQIRHLQGVTDQIITWNRARNRSSIRTVSARVEVGRTSRLQVMLIGELTDFDGSKHLISYTSRSAMISSSAWLLRAMCPWNRLPAHWRSVRMNPANSPQGRARQRRSRAGAAAGTALATTRTRREE